MSEQQETINYTPEMLQRLKAAYAEHQAKGKDAVFEFEGHEYHVGYTKYLIEYLENCFAGR